KGYARGVKTIEKEVKKDKIKAEKAISKLMKKTYNCQEDARKEVEEFASELVYHACKEIEVKKEKKMEKVGRPKKTDVGKEVYKLSCRLEENAEKIAIAKESKG